MLVHNALKLHGGIASYVSHAVWRRADRLWLVLAVAVLLYASDPVCAGGRIQFRKYFRYQQYVPHRMDTLQGYVDRAKAKLTIAPSDFGISPLRKKLVGRMRAGNQPC